jgi:hypothetical protein
VACRAYYEQLLQANLRSVGVLLAAYDECLLAKPGCRADASAHQRANGCGDATLASVRIPADGRWWKRLVEQVHDNILECNKLRPSRRAESRSLSGNFLSCLEDS